MPFLSEPVNRRAAKSDRRPQRPALSRRRLALAISCALSTLPTWLDGGEAKAPDRIPPVADRPQSPGQPPSVEPPSSGLRDRPADRETPEDQRTSAERSSSPLDQLLQRQLHRDREPRPARRAAPMSPPVDELPATMRAAAESLERGELSAAAARQADLLQRLDELLQRQPQQPAGPSSGAPEAAELAGVGQEPSDRPGAGTGAGDGAARESDPNRKGTGASQPTAPLERRRGLASAVWGHLPDRLREQMQQSYHDRYLPEYEELVDAYFEALAEEPPPVPPVSPVP